MTLLSAAQNVNQAAPVATYGGAATSASIIVAEKYQEGGFFYWVDSNALVISIGIAFTGLVIQFSSTIFILILKSRSAKHKS